MVQTIADALRAIPCKAVQKVPDRVIAVLMGSEIGGIHDLLLACQVVILFQIQPDVLHIRVDHGGAGASVIADAYVKGIPMDEKLALEAVVSTSTVPYLEGLKEYMELGYVPMEKSGSSASVTLEYGYDKWATGK